MRTRRECLFKSRAAVAQPRGRFEHNCGNKNDRIRDERKNRQPFRTGGDKSGHSDEVKRRDQATSEPAWAKAIPTPKKIVLPMIAPKILLPKVFMSLSINLMNGE